MSIILVDIDEKLKLKISRIKNLESKFYISTKFFLLDSVF